MITTILFWSAWILFVLLPRPTYIFSKLFKGGKVLYPFILLNDRYKTKNSITRNKLIPAKETVGAKRIKQHELIHYAQIKELGVFPAYVIYFLEYWCKWTAIQVYKHYWWDFALLAIDNDNTRLLRTKRELHLKKLYRYSELYPYICVSFEVEAFMCEDVEEYMLTRKRYSFLKYLFRLNL